MLIFILCCADCTCTCRISKRWVKRVFTVPAKFALGRSVLTQGSESLQRIDPDGLKIFITFISSFCQHEGVWMHPPAIKNLGSGYFAYVWSRQSAAVTVDDWMAKCSSFLIQGRLLIFSRIMAAKNTEKFVSLADMDLRHYFPRGERKPKYEMKNWSYLAWVVAILTAGWERKSTTRVFATGWFGQVPGLIYSDTSGESITEFF